MTTVNDIKERSVEEFDQVLYSTTHGNLQVGRVLEVTEEGYLKVIGKGNKRELTIKEPDKQIFLLVKGYYIKHRKLKA